MNDYLEGIEIFLKAKGVVSEKKILKSYQNYIKELRKKSEGSSLYFSPVKDCQLWSQELPYKILNEPNPKTFIRNKEDLKNAIKDLEAIYEKLSIVAPQRGRSFFRRTVLSITGGVSWLKFDPNLVPSLITEKYREENGPIFLRMSTPTYGSSSWIKPAKIVPEFFSYLKELSHQEKKHLYINLQDSRHPLKGQKTGVKDFFKIFGIQNEYSRTKALKNLQYFDQKGSFTYLSLSKDGTFYHQSGFFQKEQSYKDFLSDFQKQISSEDEGFYLPSFYQKILSDILQDLKSRFFNQKDILSVEDKKNLIEISYVVFVLTISHNFSYVNISCKDAIDRAGCFHGLMRVWMILQDLEQKDHPSIKNDLLYWLMSDALAMKHRPPLKERFKRFLNASFCLLENF